MSIDRVSDGDCHLPPTRIKSRSMLGVRSSRLRRLLSERIGGLVLVLIVRFLGLCIVRDSSETSRIVCRHRGFGVLNNRDFKGISDDGEGAGC